MAVNSPGLGSSEAIQPHRPSVFALVAISTLSPFAINSVVASMPALEVDFATDYGTVQLVLSVFLGAIAFAQIAIGPLSDRFGRRPILLGGLGIFILASIASVFAPTIESLVILRAIQGAGGCAGIVLGRAIIRDLYDRRQAASMIGYVTMGMSVAPMVAPLIGGLLQESFNWQAQFWFMAGLGIACIAIAWINIGETNHSPTDSIAVSSMLKDFTMLLRSRSFLLYTASSSLSSAVFFSFLGGGPYVADRFLNLAPTVYGAWFASIAIGYFIGNFFSGRFAERVGVRRMILIGSTIMMVSLSLLVLLFALGISTAASFFLPMAFGALANGMVLPSAVSGAISVRPDRAGSAAGLTGAIQIGMGALISAEAGILLAQFASPFALFAVMVLAGTLALLTAFAIWRYDAAQEGAHKTG